MLTLSLLLCKASTFNCPDRSLELEESRAYSRKLKNLLNDRKYQGRRKERLKAKLIEMKKNNVPLIPTPVMRRLNSRFLVPKVVRWNFKGPLWLLEKDFPERYVELLTESADRVFAGFDLSPTSGTVVGALPLTVLLVDLIKVMLQRPSPVSWRIVRSRRRTNQKV